MPMHPSSGHGSKPLVAGEMTQLQWLAGLAMQALIERMSGIPDTEAEREEIALWAYRMAQAMKRIEARVIQNKEES